MAHNHTIGSMYTYIETLNYHFIPTRYLKKITKVKKLKQKFNRIGILLTTIATLEGNNGDDVWNIEKF